MKKLRSLIVDKFRGQLRVFSMLFGKEIENIGEFQPRKVIQIDYI
jgi:hypothetical protein